MVPAFILFQTIWATRFVTATSRLSNNRQHRRKPDDVLWGRIVSCRNTFSTSRCHPPTSWKLRRFSVCFKFRPQTEQRRQILVVKAVQVMQSSTHGSYSFMCVATLYSHASTQQVADLLLGLEAPPSALWEAWAWIRHMHWYCTGVAAVRGWDNRPLRC